MGKQRKQWSEEQKLTIVLAALRDEQSIAELSRQYGVNDNLIYKWNHLGQAISDQHTIVRLHDAALYIYTCLNQLSYLFQGHGSGFSMGRNGCSCHLVGFSRSLPSATSIGSSYAMTTRL